MMKKLIIILLSLAFTLVYPEIGCRLANYCCELFSIGWMYVHHIVQMILALLTIYLIILIKKETFTSFGFTFKNWKWSTFVALKFAAGWILVVLIMNLVFTNPNTISYEINFKNVLADLFFDFVVTGFSEEIFFRGLIYSVIMLYIPGNLKIGKLSVSYGIIISTLLFSLAHIGVNYHTLSIESINYMQLIFTFGLGMFYAVMREKSGSLFGPIIAHGISDGSITVIQLFLS